MLCVSQFPTVNSIPCPCALISHSYAPYCNFLPLRNLELFSSSSQLLIAASTGLSFGQGAFSSMKPVHRESNLDVDYVISFKIPPDGIFACGREGDATLTSPRPNESNCSVQEADPVFGRRGAADGSTKWQRQLPDGICQGSGRESVRRCGLQIQVCCKIMFHKHNAKSWPESRTGCMVCDKSSPIRIPAKPSKTSP